jgi:hypothetical protein
MTASCGIWLERFPVREKMVAPIKVNPSAMPKVGMIHTAQSAKIMRLLKVHLKMLGGCAVRIAASGADIVAIEPIIFATVS